MTSAISSSEASARSAPESGPPPTRTSSRRRRPRAAVRGPEEVVGSLDLGHPAEPADDEPIRSDPELGPHGGAGPRLDADSPLEIEAEPDDRDPLRGRDSEPHEIVANLRADRDERIGDGREAPLDPNEGRRLRGPEVAAEHVTVIGVDDDRRPRRARQHGCRPPDGPGLGRVGVEDVRPEITDQGPQAANGRRVDERGDLPLELGDVDRVHAELLGDILHRPLAASHTPGHEHRLVADLVELLAQIRDVQRGPPDVQPGDHAKDAYRIAGARHALRRVEAQAGPLPRSTLPRADRIGRRAPRGLQHLGRREAARPRLGIDGVPHGSSHPNTLYACGSLRERLLLPSQNRQCWPFFVESPEAPPVGWIMQCRPMAWVKRTAGWAPACAPPRRRRRRLCQPTKPCP